MEVKECFELQKDFELVSGACELLFGKHIGSGLHRDVYEYAPDKRYVIKVERDPETLCNMREFLFWDTILYQDDIKKWLCPVKEMSANGRVLIMQKMQPITEKNKHKIPKKIPVWLSDMKWDNYGFIGDQFVCCDYPFSSNYALSNVSKSLKNWKSHLNEK